MPHADDGLFRLVPDALKGRAATAVAVFPLGYGAALLTGGPQVRDRLLDWVLNIQDPTTVLAILVTIGVSAGWVWERREHGALSREFRQYLDAESRERRDDLTHQLGVTSEVMRRLDTLEQAVKNESAQVRDGLHECSESVRALHRETSDRLEKLSPGS